MKLSSKTLACLSLAFWILVGPALLFASKKVPSRDTKPESFSLPVEYSFPSGTKLPLLKWPRGSLIYPEVNQPENTTEVFLLDEAFTFSPELYSLHHHYGLQFFSRKEYGRAKTEFLKALKQHPNIPGMHKRLGLIYLKLNNYKNAEAAYRKALRLDPGYTSGIIKLGISLAGQKKFNLAERSFKKAIKAEPGNANYHLNLGNYYFYLRNNFKGAKRSYQRALELDPKLVEAKNNLRSIKQKFKKLKNKESDFKSSWGTDFDYDDSKNENRMKSSNSKPEEANISDSWEEQNNQNPLF